MHQALDLTVDNSPAASLHFSTSMHSTWNDARDSKHPSSNTWAENYSAGCLIPCSVCWTTFIRGCMESLLWFAVAMSGYGSTVRNSLHWWVLSHFLIPSETLWFHRLTAKLEKRNASRFSRGELDIWNCARCDIRVCMETQSMRGSTWTRSNTNGKYPLFLSSLCFSNTPTSFKLGAFQSFHEF
jgi:hypothetical protein